MFFEVYEYADAHRGYGWKQSVDFIEADNLEQAKAIAYSTWGDYYHGIREVNRAYVETSLIHFEDQQAHAASMVRIIDNLFRTE